MTNRHNKEKSFNFISLGAVFVMAIALGGALALMYGREYPKQPDQPAQRADRDGSPALMPAIKPPCDRSRAGIDGASATGLRGATLVEPWQPFLQDIFGFSHKVRKIETVDVPAGQALEVSISKRGRQPYDFGLSMLNVAPIRDGDYLEARVWLRAKQPNAQGDPISIVARLQDNEAPGYKRVSEQTLVLTNVFKEYVVPGRAVRAYCSGELNFALHLATAKQVLEVGPATIFVVAKPVSP
jgi:hypothetical protein